MTHDLEDRLVALLHRRADDEVDADGLLRRALTQGRAWQRRRRLLVAFGAAGLAGLTAAALAAVPILGASGDRAPRDPATPPDARTESPWPSHTGPMEPPAGVGNKLHALPPTGGYAVPQLAVAGPGAVERPDLVGTDPQTIHFGLPDVSMPVNYVMWYTAAGVERVRLALKAPDGEMIFVNVEVARGAVPRPGLSGLNRAPRLAVSPSGSIGGQQVMRELLTYKGWVERAVRWSPADGIEVRVSSMNLSSDDLVRLASRVRLDRAVGCRVPLRLTALPSDTSVTGCLMTLEPDPGAMGYRAAMGTQVLTLRRGDSSMTVTANNDTVKLDGHPGRTARPADETAGERPATGDRGPSVEFDLGDRHVIIETGTGYNRDDVRLVAAGIRPVGGRDRPHTWPERPVS